MTWKVRGRMMIALGLCAYLGGYAWVRYGGWIVHRAEFYTAPDRTRKVAGHDLALGDFGVPMFHPVFSGLAYTAYGLYWPVRRLEWCVWRLAVPLDSSWPAEWKAGVTGN